MTWQGHPPQPCIARTHRAWGPQHRSHASHEQTSRRAQGPPPRPLSTHPTFFVSLSLAPFSLSSAQPARPCTGPLAGATSRTSSGRRTLGHRRQTSGLPFLCSTPSLNPLSLGTSGADDTSRAWPLRACAGREAGREAAMSYAQASGSSRARVGGASRAPPARTGQPCLRSTPIAAVDTTNKHETNDERTEMN